MAESSSSAPALKPVVVRVKRKPFQSPLDAFWLEINERPLKRAFLDFGNLSISDSAQHVEFQNKKVFMQHVETITSSEVTFDILQSFFDPVSSGISKWKSKIEERKNFFKKHNKQDQLLFKAKQEKESSVKDARFEQIWKSRRENKRTAQEKELQDMCHFYDIVRVDSEENSKEVQKEDISLEDQRLLSSYLPLLREFIPDAATEVEVDLLAHSKKDDFVYDFYTMNDEMDTNVDDSSHAYPLVQVDEEDYYDGPDYSDYESDDSNAENNPLNDYPEETSEEDEEEDEASESESEEREQGDGDDNEESSDDNPDHGSSCDAADPLYDEDFDDYEGVDGNDSDDVDPEDEHWRYRYR